MISRVGGTIICALLLITITYYVIRFVKRFVFYLRLPGPPYNWLLRHEVDLTAGDLSEIRDFKRKYNEKYPQICRYFLGPFVFLSISDPETIKYFLGQKPPKPSIYRLMLDRWIGDGLLSSNGRKWQRNRKLLTPAFHYSILSSFLPVYCKATHVMLDLWEELSVNGGEIVVQEFAQYLTLDILMQCIGSLETNCQVKRETIPYVNDVNMLTHISLLRFLHNLYKIDLYFYLTPTGRLYKQASKRSRAFTRNLIAEHVDKLSSNGSSNKQEVDFINILLTTRDQNGNRLTDQEICDEIDTFVFEGHDTTATALTWILCYLTLYPEHQETCRNEIMNYFNEHDLELQDLPKLEFLTMFIKETMRLQSPVYSVIREVDTPVSLGGYLVPRGSLVEIAILTLHTNKNVWPDPCKFDPMRFSKENINKVSPYNYIPFSAGERNCIGQVFAMNELRVVCSLILKKYRLEFQEPFLESELTYERDILNKLKTPLKLRLLPIKENN
ncbi:Cytochrome P450 4B1-like isoform X1 [Oopsacas minuta]|uniref:Cytochrome P450 4B1-like isoform X1 n=1 Tax=Oopsacas minuta TaxID=111878 RepID=A0AAV7KGP9_9METZ|nr:Cytochrome P450 4B1-like isoform X1 [Oopsacas minuta]